MCETIFNLVGNFITQEPKICVDSQSLSMNHTVKNCYWYRNFFDKQDIKKQQNIFINQTQAPLKQTRRSQSLFQVEVRPQDSKTKQTTYVKHYPLQLLVNFENNA